MDGLCKTLRILLANCRFPPPPRCPPEAAALGGAAALASPPPRRLNKAIGLTIGAAVAACLILAAALAALISAKVLTLKLAVFSRSHPSAETEKFMLVPETV